jgi:hypothetical protein
MSKPFRTGAMDSRKFLFTVSREDPACSAAALEDHDTYRLLEVVGSGFSLTSFESRRHYCFAHVVG